MMRSVHRDRPGQGGAMAMARVPLDELRDVTLRAVRSYGHSDDEARTIVDVLLYAQLRGNNQGVVKLIGPGIPKDPAAGELTVRRAGAAIATIDAARTHAMVAVNRAVDVILELVEGAGIGLVAVRALNTSS